MARPPIPVDAFELRNPIGRGGMGEVWEGVHVASGVPVAVKILTAKRARQRTYRRAFRNEVRAMASLDHPNICEVHDYGILDEAAAEASEGTLDAGLPYMALELVSGGTLGRRRGRLGWPDLRAVLAALLDALAHAHARGVIHKDLKPGNVLFGTGGEGIRLTDFGLAHAMDREGLTLETPADRIAGTPAYMAPEQFVGTNRDIGPWTDLYALGCLVFTMITGAPPLGRKPWQKVAQDHLKKPVPSLILAPMPLPDGIEEWVSRLLAKAPAQRYRRCADAMWDLLELEDPTHEHPSMGTETETVATTSFQSGPSTLVWRRGALDISQRRSVLPVVRTVPATWQSLPPMPFSWRRPQRERSRSRQLGVGLGVHALREIPLVDREDERETLWSALRQVRRHGRPFVAYLSGPAGCGRSKIANWLCTRAHELGAATVLRAVHSPQAEHREGLSGMVASHLRCMGLPQLEQAEHVRDWLDQQQIKDLELAKALSEMVAATAKVQRPRHMPAVRFRSKLERFAVVREVVRRAAEERPVILWLDDVQWGLDALAFAADVVERGDLSVLVLLTTRDEALDYQGSAVETLEHLSTGNYAERVRVGPLAEQYRMELLQDRLGLGPALATQLDRRTRGNPQFAVRLVEDWIRRALLLPGPGGFRLREGEMPELPDDLHEAWLSTIDELLEGRSEDAGVALEVASVLGQRVSADEWSRACRRLGVRQSASVFERLVERRLIRVEDPEVGWDFVHGMLRESLLRRAADGGRLERHHLAAADALVGQLAPAELARRARHLGAGANDEAALHAFLDAAEAHAISGNAEQTSVQIQGWEQAAKALSMGDFTPEYRHGSCRAAAALRTAGQLSLALRYAERCAQLGRTYDDPSTLRTGLRERGRVALLRGRPDEARKPLRTALVMAERAGETHETALLASELGQALAQSGQLERAQELLLRAVGLHKNAGTQSEAGGAWMGLSDLARRSGQYDLAKKWATSALAAYGAADARWGSASATNALADIARLRGDLDAAEAGYLDALERMERLGQEDNAAAAMNLAHVRLLRGEVGQVRAHVEKWWPRSDPHLSSHRILGHLLLLCCCAHEGHWQEWDERLRSCRRLLHDTGWVDVDVASLAAHGGALAAAVGETERGASAYAIAEAQYRSLGRTSEAASVAERRKKD